MLLSSGRRRGRGVVAGLDRRLEGRDLHRRAAGLAVDRRDQLVEALLRPGLNGRVPQVAALREDLALLPTGDVLVVTLDDLADDLELCHFEGHRATLDAGLPDKILEHLQGGVSNGHGGSSCDGLSVATSGRVIPRRRPLVNLVRREKLWLHSAMTHTVTIEKLVFGGQGMARLPDGKVVFVWNALPGEEVEIEIIKKKKDVVEAVATKILKPSPERVEPKDNHFLSSAPWQMMDWSKENDYKQQIAVEQYGRIGGLILSANPPEVVSAGEPYGYRNKIEFSFVPKDPEIYQNSPDWSEMSLAFFQRGKKHRIPIEHSSLAEPVINDVAKDILAWVNKQQIPPRSLKSLIIRSNGEGQALAALFLKDELSFSDYPETNDTLLGLQVYYSTHKSPAAVPTKLLHSDGQDFLTANIKGTKLKFGALSFFQINIPMFETALDDTAAFIPPKAPLIDFYAGVGAISLPISYNRAETILVDNNEEAIDYAKENIAANKLANCRAECVPAENITEIITSGHILIVDPPRAGLHKKMIHRIMMKRPPRIVYLSCNIATQARDIRLLEEYYRVRFLKLYNFFPRTPHIEGLCILERI